MVSKKNFQLVSKKFQKFFNSIIMALCKTCDMPNCLHCAHCSSCHKYIQSPNYSSCYSNQQQPKTSASFTCSACVSFTIPFFNLTNTELYNLLLFDNSDLSNFIESFPCDLSAQNFQTKYSTLSETGEMNHASKQKKYHIFTLLHVAWEKISTWLLPNDRGKSYFHSHIRNQIEVELHFKCWHPCL